MKTNHLFFALKLLLLVTGSFASAQNAPASSRLEEVMSAPLFVKRFFTVCHNEVYAYLQKDLSSPQHEFIIRDLDGSHASSVAIRQLREVRSVEFSPDCSSFTVHQTDSKITRTLPYKINKDSIPTESHGQFQIASLPLRENEVFFQSENGELLRPFKNQVGRHHLLHRSNQEVFIFRENLIEQSIQHYSLKDKKVKTLVRFKPEVNASFFRVNLESAKKTSLPGYVIQSRNSKGLVIFVHGGGCWMNDSHVDATMYSPEVFDIVQAGFDMLFISYSGDDDPILNIPDTQVCGVDEVIDVVAALGFVKSRINPKNIFLMGESYGAYLINLMVGRFPNLPLQGAISKFGVWDLERQQHFLPYPKRFEMNELNDPKLFMANIKAPLLLLHGQKDQAVAFTNTSFLLSQTEALGLNVEALTPERMGHGFDYSTVIDFETKLLWHQKLLHFLESHSND